MRKLIGTYAVKLVVWLVGHPDTVVDIVQGVKRAKGAGK